MTTTIAGRLSAVLLLSCSSLAANESPDANDEVLIRLHDRTKASQPELVAQIAGASNARRRYADGHFTLRLPTDPNTRAAVLDNLRRDPHVAELSVNGMGQGGYVPSDTLYGDQWHLETADGVDINAPEAWETARGDEGVIIAVLDSGILLDQPEFTGRIAVNELETLNGVDDDGNGLVDDISGWDFTTDDNDPTDEHGHGTWVTSVLAANADGEFGVVGVDHRSRILPIRVLDADNRGSLADLVDGIHYAIDAGARVINLSLIDYPYSSLLDAALNRAEEAGVTVVACAGNAGADTANSSYPGAHPATISVGATDHADNLAWFSSTGSSVTFTAPGEQIAAADHLPPYEPDVAVLRSGCSLATPIVSGIVGLVESVSPGLRRTEMEALLAASAIDLGAPGWDPEFGWGRVDAAAAMGAIGSTSLFRDSFE